MINIKIMITRSILSIAVITSNLYKQFDKILFTTVTKVPIAKNALVHIYNCQPVIGKFQLIIFCRLIESRK